MLSHRLLMSALLIPSTIGLFMFDHHLGESAMVLLALVLAIAVRCVWELSTLARSAGYQPREILLSIATTLLLVTIWWPHSQGEFRSGMSTFQPAASLFGTLAFIVVALLANAVFRFPLPELDRQTTSTTQGTGHENAIPNLGREIGTLGVELLIVAYAGVLLAMTSQLRWVGGAISGYFALGALVVAAKTGDIGAYTFGRLIGGPKMTPKLSPGKTWAGGFGHLVTAGLCSIGWLCWLGPMICSSWKPWQAGPAAVFGVVVGFAGLVGDLAESLIKRDVGAKDAPVLLPGFGGLLDVMDSILLAGPVAYGMWQLLV